MVGSRNDIEMRITADSRAVAAGLAPAMKGLDGVQKAAAETESALEGVGGKPITLTVNDQAIENARAEITRLREGMRAQLSTDVNADTSTAERRIRELQRSIRTLDAQHPVVEVRVDVDADTSQVSQLAPILNDISGSVPGLSRLAPALTAVGASGAAAATGVGIGAVAIVGLTNAAADAETQVTQLNALTGGLGEETFADLQKWAAETPFAIEDATEATKKLVAAGVPLEDIPDWLNDIGNTAAATGVPLAQAATVFAQMVSKGKASYEELQQLAESGIPVWQVLADQLGLTVAEVQKMATEGKLGADAINLAREGINELYPTAMQQQAETFNGQMSTLDDNLSQTGQTLGTLFLPLMSELVEGLNLAANWLLVGSRYLTEWDSKLRDLTGGVGVFETFVDAIPGVAGLRQGMSGLGDETEDTADAAVDLGSEVDQLAADVKAGMESAEDAAKAFAAEVKEAEQEVADAIAAFAGLGGEVRTTVSFIISKDDLREQIDEAIEGTKDQHPVTLPADLNVTQIAGLGDLQQDLIGSISSFAEMGLEEGARRAELDPTFDSQAWLEQVRRDTRGLLIEAGVDTDEVSRVLSNVVGLPRVVPVSADVTKAQETLDTLNAEPVSVPVAPFFPQEPGEEGKKTPAWLSELTAPITPEVVAPDAAAATLDNVAAPGGEQREADILVHLDALSLAAARQALNLLTLTETKIIKVHLQENPTGADLSRPGAVDQMLSGAVGGSGGSGGSAGLPGRPRQLAPRQTPIAVYLDGVEIANRIAARRGMAATESVRRSA